MKTHELFWFSLLAVFALVLSACGDSSKEPTPTPINTNLIAAQAIATFSMGLTQTALAQPTATATATLTATPTPKPVYPVFDHPEDILTPEKLPFVSIDDVFSGKFGEIILRMYQEGKIRQISPSAKPYTMKWGNQLLDSLPYMNEGL